MNTKSSIMFHLAVDQPYTGPGLCVMKRGIALLKLIREAHKGVTELATLFNFYDGRHQDRCDEFIELMAHSLACHSPEFVRDVMEAAAMSASIRESGDSASSDNDRDAASLDPFADPTEDEIGELARRGGEALGPDVTQEDIRNTLTDVLAEVAEHRRTVKKGVAGAICVLGPKVFGDELVAKAEETLKTSEMSITDEDSLP